MRTKCPKLRNSIKRRQWSTKKHRKIPNHKRKKSHRKPSKAQEIKQKKSKPDSPNKPWTNLNFNNDLVVTPIERMLVKVRRISKNPLEAARIEEDLALYEEYLRSEKL